MYDRGRAPPRSSEPFWGPECFAPSGFPCQVIAVASVPRNRRSVTLVAWCPPSVDSLGLTAPSPPVDALARVGLRGGVPAAVRSAIASAPALLGRPPPHCGSGWPVADCMGCHREVATGCREPAFHPVTRAYAPCRRHPVRVPVARQGIEPCCRSDGFTDRCPTLGPARMETGTCQPCLPGRTDARL